ncbi:RNA-binding protein [Ancylobacter terrae]|uniref:RNA-binding protein n=1 Tax=Ancylobacter sp. sgz301288 TaxID=3342077 RepID=UPI00385DAF20
MLAVERDEDDVAVETDAGPAAARGDTARLCLATREVTPVVDMLRFVVAPDGTLVPDIARKLPGRGAWVTATRSALDGALKRKAFGRAFRGKAKAGADAALPALVEDLLVRDALAALALANKAGRVVTGTAKVESALGAGGVAALLHATDAAPDGCRKLDSLARRLAGDESDEIAVVSCLPGVQLDLALGRANVVHAALLAHPTTAGFLARCRRLERWRAG